MFLPHQQRVIDEAKELSIKLDALEKFTDPMESPVFRELDRESQSLLLIQANCMASYFGVLRMRMERFGYVMPD